MPAEEGERIRLPLLSRLLDRAIEEQPGIWLDLGRIQAGLVARLGQCGGRLLVADLPSEPALGETQPSLDKYWPKACRNAPADRICAWNLFDYCQPAGLNQLAREMAARSAPNCLVHALIQYSSAEMPAFPGTIRLEETGEVRIVPVTANQYPAPRYSPRRLEKLMPRFVVEQTMLLNNGMQEMLLRLRDS